MAFELEPTPPPGRELYRFATVNDVHIGETRFGFPIRYREPDDVEPYPARCLRAALAEAKAWGAERVLGKGDLTDRGSEEECDWFAQLARESGVPINTLLGNHDIRDEDTDAAVALRRRGIPVATETEALDVPGLRIILLPSAFKSHEGLWSPDNCERALALAAEAAAPVFVATHHYPQRFNVPTEYPDGVPARSARPFLEELNRVAPGSVIACGHTHRHHRRHYKSLLITEIGSTKDWPGVWAGYRVFEGGIMQTVHHVAEPSARAWINRTSSTLFGAWRYWSPGLRTHRNWSWNWPAR